MWAVSHQKSDSRGWLFSSVLGCYQHPFWKVKFSSFFYKFIMMYQTKIKILSVIVLIISLYPCGSFTLSKDSFWKLLLVDGGGELSEFTPPTVHWLLANSTSTKDSRINGYEKETLVLMTLFLCQVYAAYVWLFCWPKTPASNISSPSNIKCNEARDIKMTFLILSKGE